MRLTPRDLSLLELLCQNTVMSFEEVRLFAFQGKHKATVCNRLGKLEEMAVIRRINVGNFIYKQNMRVVGVVVQITRRGIDVLKKCERFRPEWKSEPVPLNIQSLIHDLELNRVVRRLAQELPGATITNGKHLVSDGGGIHSKIPDAVLEVAEVDLGKAKQLGIVAPDARPRHGSSVRIGVELELTAKSDRRYREIITGYRLSREVERVLYISHDGAVFRKIQSVLAGFAVKGEFRPHVGQFSFLPMSFFDEQNAKSDGKQAQSQSSDLAKGPASVSNDGSLMVQKNYSEVS